MWTNLLIQENNSLQTHAMNWYSTRGQSMAVEGQQSCTDGIILSKQGEISQVYSLSIPWRLKMSMLVSQIGSKVRFLAGPGEPITWSKLEGSSYFPMQLKRTEISESKRGCVSVGVHAVNRTRLWTRRKREKKKKNQRSRSEARFLPTSSA